MKYRPAVIVASGLAGLCFPTIFLKTLIIIFGVTFNPEIGDVVALAFISTITATIGACAAISLTE